MSSNEVSEAGFSILWEASTKHTVYDAWCFAQGSRLLLKNMTSDGFVCFDPEVKEAVWQYRTGDSVSKPVELGEWILTERLDDWIRISIETGDSSKVEGLKTCDTFCGCHHRFGIFALDEVINEEFGCAVFDLETAEVRRFGNKPEYLTPWGVHEDRFLATSDEDLGEPYWVGSLCPDSGAVLRERSKPIQIHAAGYARLTGKTAEGFVIGDSKSCRLWYYSWSGELIAEFDHPGAAKDPELNNGSFKVARDANGDWLLLTSHFRKDQPSQRLFCFELGNTIHPRWEAEIPFILDGRHPCVEGRMIVALGLHGFPEGARDEFGDGKDAARVVSLKDGSIRPLTDIPVAHWVATADHRVFIGRAEPNGSKRIVCGEFVSEL